MSPERSVSVQEVENKAEIIELDSAVRDYLETHPPTLGHGYSHLKEVARFSYQLALDNNFPHPKIAYVCGLLHDLHRPAMGGGLEEHEEQTAQASQELLSKTPFANQTQEIAAAILNHDEIILGGKSTPLMEILSIADKQAMTFQRAVAYSWASNRSLKDEGKVAYASFMETMRDFCLYQVKAWKVFLTVHIKGVNQAVEAYLKTHEDLSQAVREELTGIITYQNKSLELAKKEAELEKELLKKAGAREETIQRITANFSEPID